MRDDQLALDIVQDAMLKLTEKYCARPLDELPRLFQRILQNTIHDFHRRQRVRSMWTLMVSSLFGHETDEDADPLETLGAASSFRNLSIAVQRRPTFRRRHLNGPSARNSLL